MRKLLTILVAAMALSVMLVAPAGAHAGFGATRYTTGDDTIGPEIRHTARQATLATVVREFNEDGTAAPGTEQIGWSRLVRSADGLRATVFVRGLKPGGVYTFWWVVPQEPFTGEDDGPAIPGEVFVARGAGRVIGDSGEAVVGMQAYKGQAGIEGAPFLPDGAQWDTLNDPLNSTVRVEIAYHGQADAGDDIRPWLSDFWTGAACPEPGEANAAGQPFCPVYLAATHTP